MGLIIYIKIIMVEIDDNNEKYDELTITDIKMLLEYTQFKNDIFLNTKLLELMNCAEDEIFN